MRSNKIRFALPILALLVAGVAAHGIGMTVAAGGAYAELSSDWIYYVVLFASAAACLLRAALVREDRLAWALIGLGGLFWVAGDLSWTLAYGDDRHPTYPSLADYLYLANYPMIAAGVLLLARSASPGRRSGVGLDGAMAGLGAAAIGAALLGPALGGWAEAEPAEAVVTAAYPVGDMIVLGAAAAAAVVLGWRRDFALLGLGLVAMAISDTAYLYAEATSGYVEGTLADTGWVLSAALIGIAAWQPRPRRALGSAGARAIAVPGLIALIAAGLLLFDHFARLPTISVVLATATVALAVARLALAYAENAGLLNAARTDALTDALTGLGNRRHLIAELERAAEDARAGEGRYVFAIFDLDGFKGYNDTFGHAAGDLLLRRMGRSLAAAVSAPGRAYRLGGDEFCILAPVGDARPDPIVAAAAAALREDGEGFAIASSHGRTVLPDEVGDPTEALRVADRRLYADKGTSSRSIELQARDLLLGVLRERGAGLRVDGEGIGKWATELARRLDLEAEKVDVIGRAADLHDVGKMAIPDEILTKEGPLSADEWALMRTHTLIGERMVSVAPALAPVGRLIRSSHERWDGAVIPTASPVPRSRSAPA